MPRTGKRIGRVIPSGKAFKIDFGRRYSKRYLYSFRGIVFENESLAEGMLAAIELEYDAEQDFFYATATIGGEMFERYFSDFHDRLVLQYGRFDIDQPMTDTTQLMRLSEYTQHAVSCSV